MSDDVIEKANLRIAKARDGRNILYATNLNINNGIAVDKGAASKRAAVLAAMPSGKKVSQKATNVNPGMNSLRNDVYDSPRSILARALASEAKTPVDRDALKRYQDKVGEYKNNLS